MDIFFRVVYAGRIDLTIGILSTLFSLMIGVSLGLLVAYYEGFSGEVVMRIMDLLQAFPVFIFGHGACGGSGQ